MSHTKWFVDLDLWPETVDGAADVALGMVASFKGFVDVDEQSALVFAEYEPAEIAVMFA